MQVSSTRRPTLLHLLKVLTISSEIPWHCCRVIKLLNFLSDASTSHKAIVLFILLELLGVFLGLLGAVVLCFVSFGESWLVGCCTSAQQASICFDTFKDTRSCRVWWVKSSRHQWSWLLTPYDVFICPIYVHGLAWYDVYVQRWVCVYSPSWVKRAFSHHIALIRLAAV